MMFDLKEVSSNDHQFLVDLHNDPVVLHNLTNNEPITLEQHIKWWDRIIHSNTELRLIFTVDGCNAGFTKFYSIDHANHCCVLGADLHKEYRGKGYAKPMWTLMLDRCFNDLNLHRVSLTTASYNLIAHKVYKNLGFKEEGRLTESLLRDGVYHDQIAMFLLRKDWRSQ